MVFLGVFFFSATRAQQRDLLVRGSDKGLYLDHKVVAKETYFGLGRYYNLRPRSIASFNGLDMNKGLKIDQKIRIPLLDTNFSQNGNSGTPVYYKAGDDESLESVSRKHKNVSVASLRAWNGLQGDRVKKDTRLVIGFLHSKEMKSVTLTPPAQEPMTAIVKNDPPPAPQPPAEESTRKEEKKIAEAEKKGEEKDEKEQKKNPTPVITEIRKPVIEGQGYFQRNFEQQVRTTPATKEEMVTAGIFKTTSGWDDAKYYLLMDKVQPGVIVKVINPSTNKAVYAKVLGVMAGIRQNEGYDIRISNAAASALEISDQEKFVVKLNY